MNIFPSSISIHRLSCSSPFGKTLDDDRRIPPNDLTGYIQISETISLFITILKNCKEALKIFIVLQPVLQSLCPFIIGGFIVQTKSMTSFLVKM